MRATEFKQYLNRLVRENRPLDQKDVNIIWMHCRGDLIVRQERNIEAIWEMLSSITDCLRLNNLSIDYRKIALYDPNQRKLTKK
jgi:hypothetical protein